MALLPDRSLQAWLGHLEQLHPRGEAGVELGLERVRQVSIRLGQRQSFPVVTVAGTNGKGSTCALIERMLLSAGYRVGVYSSPHLLRYNERVRIGGVPAQDAAFSAAFARVEAGRADVPLTYFEFGTLAAWEMFAAAGLEVVILEVGLGGRLDATNIYDADCAVITTVDLDHTDYLGATREQIGHEKAGICRPGRPLVCGDTEPPRSVIDSCRLAGAEFRCIGSDFGYSRQEGQWQFWDRGGRKLGGLAFPALRGACQLRNATCALAVLEALRDRLPVTAQDIRSGLGEVELAGRCQVLPGRPQIILDVAHNPQAARQLAESLGDMGFARRTTAVLGMMADKDIAGVVDALRGRVDRWWVCDLPGLRAAPATLLAEVVGKRIPGADVRAFSAPSLALADARETAGDDDRILTFGSFLTVADAMRSLNRG